MSLHYWYMKCKATVPLNMILCVQLFPENSILKEHIWVCYSNHVTKSANLGFKSKCIWNCKKNVHSPAEGHYVEDNDQTWLYVELLVMKAPECL